ncbi:hypothetical protein [Pseudoclavibacter sp. AY1H1]|uniref:hypothetical protein n=1 Tax=Pseudoclavibacter sp. AY1H1 TaxID=2080584 RepID=UPI000CE80FB6|nr:hypothetical protein [Pseudoclavibacter sp. AY1H1]PPF40016.1 hypothetical protein C5E05_02035 [Pseudoclavibacter sp. AY1H1]
MVLFDWREDQDAKMVDPNLSVYSVESIASQTSTFRAELEQRVADAQARQVNAGGSVSEGIVDAAGHSKMTTVHELAHVFQKADDTRYPDDRRLSTAPPPGPVPGQQRSNGRLLRP